MTTFRPARETDLETVFQIFYLNETAFSTQPPPFPDTVAPEMQHVFQTGKMYVAEQDGQVQAYAASITRGRITYLTDLFVHPTYHSTHLGQNLLPYVLSEHHNIHCTVSTPDFRAQSLYIRAGMQPQWPNYLLAGGTSLDEDLLATDTECIESYVSNTKLVQWDEQISGRPRAVDHTYWVREERAVPLWFQKNGEIIGYGYVRLGAGTFWSPQTCAIGPIGAHTPEHAVSCTLAALRWASKRAKVLRIDVPGPHPALAPLLRAGMRLVYIETFASNARQPFFDARCYIPASSALF
jgi:hypothetical protein